MRTLWMLVTAMMMTAAPTAVAKGLAPTHTITFPEDEWSQYSGYCARARLLAVTSGDASSGARIYELDLARGNAKKVATLAAAPHELIWSDDCGVLAVGVSVTDADGRKRHEAQVYRVAAGQAELRISIKDFALPIGGLAFIGKSTLATSTNGGEVALWSLDLERRAATALDRQAQTWDWDMMMGIAASDTCSRSAPIKVESGSRRCGTESSVR